MEKLDSFQGNKKEDIDKRKKKKKNDAQVPNIPGATQTPADIKNHEHDVNPELSKFQDSPHCAAHEENFRGTLMNRRGHIVEPSSHT